MRKNGKRKKKKKENNTHTHTQFLQIYKNQKNQKNIHTPSPLQQYDKQHRQFFQLRQLHPRTQFVQHTVDMEHYDFFQLKRIHQIVDLSTNSMMKYHRQLMSVLIHVSLSEALQRQQLLLRG